MHLPIVRLAFHVYDRDQKWSLSPAYDINPSPEGDETRRLALGVGRNKAGEMIRDANIDVALTDCRSFYFSPAEAKALVDELVGHMKTWEKHFATCGVSQATIQKIASAFLRVRQLS